MNSIQLEYFLKIANSGSFTAAAKQLYLSQPALSKQIRLLEEELNTLLFIRLPKGVKLTAEGKVLYEQAEEIIRKIRNISIGINNLHHTVSGELNIVCGTYLSRKIIPPLLKRLLLKYPKICPRIREMPSREQLDYLLNGSAEIGIGVENKLQGEQKLSWHPIFRSEFILIQSDHSDLASKKRISLEDLARRNLICYPQNGLFYEVVRRIMNPYPLNVLMDSQSTETIIELVRQDFGIAFVPDYMLDPEKRTGIRIGGFPSGENVTIGYRYCSDRALSPQARAFIEVIHEKFSLSDD